MKKLRIFTILFFVGIISISFGKPIDITTAKRVATNQFVAFNKNKDKSFLLSSVKLSLQLVGKSESKQFKDEPLYYVFNNSESKGFVIVSADDAVEPILGYSYESSYSIDNPPPAFVAWMNNYKKQIENVKKYNLQASLETKSNWNKLDNADEKSLLKLQSGVSTVDPLCKAKWNQGNVYSAMCPFDNDAKERVVTGCAATALAIILKYHNFPNRGTGWSSYNHTKYGTLSANYGATTYDWASMPDVTNDSTVSPAISTLLLHCGIAINMNYNIGSAGGSSASAVSWSSSDGFVTRSPDKDTTGTNAFVAFTKYFGYSDSINAFSRDGNKISDVAWDSILINELNAKRPIYYTGSGAKGGHAFVCDGYDGTGKFNMNWGWGGLSDGFFTTKALSPGSLGTGGGGGGFNDGQEVIIGIQPKRILISSGGLKADLMLNSKLALSKDSIEVEDPFDVSFTLKNSGKVDYIGSCYVGLFNEHDKLVSKIGEELPVTLTQGNETTLKFSSTGIKNAIPGRYKVFAYYKFGNGWQFVNYTNQFINKGILNVISNNTSLELASPIKTSIQKIEVDKSFKVSFDVVNKGGTTFNGNLSIDLHDSKGEWVMSLDSFDFVTKGLAPNAKTNGLTFDIPALKEVPGSYDIVVWFKPTTGEWEWVGSTDVNINPLEINLVAPPTLPDQYEDNNTAEKAYKIIPTFSANSANFKTVNSTIHTGIDYDYYDLVLPTGSNYTITARVNDKENSEDGVYTSDVVFSYEDSKGESNVYDDIIPNKIISNNGGTIKFLVSPAFAGNIGTYSLNLKITKAVNSVEEDRILGSNIFPNPVNNLLNINFGENYQQLNLISITDMNGKELIKINFDNSHLKNKDLKVDVSELQNGSYFVVLNKGSVKASAKFTIVK